MALRKVGLLGIISIGFALLVVGSLTKFAIVGCKRNGAGLTGNSAANAPLETPLAVVEAKDIDFKGQQTLKLRIRVTGSDEQLEHWAVLQPILSGDICVQTSSVRLKSDHSL
jgi:hypothetical protein